MRDATFTTPDLTTFTRLGELGLVAIGQRLDPDEAVLLCRIAEPDSSGRWCHHCGGEGLARDTVIRRLAHEPLGWCPTTLLVRVGRYQCRECGRVAPRHHPCFGTAGAWRHTRKGDKWVTVIIDLTPVRDGTGPARLLDMVEGRSKQVFKTWLANRPKTWRDRVEVVAMDGFTGFKTATG